MPANADYEAVYLTVKEIQVRAKHGWRILGEPNKTYALFDLANETVEILAEGALQSGFDGKYKEIRLILADEPDAMDHPFAHYIVDRNGEARPLDVKKHHHKHGIKIKYKFTIKKDGQTNLLILLDAVKSIKEKKKGWELKPKFKVKECDDCDDDDDDDDDDEEDDDRRRRLDQPGGIV